MIRYVAGLALVALLAGCGGAPTPALTEAASRTLQSDTLRLTEAVRDADRPAARAALAALRAHVAAALADGDLTQTRAEQILATAARIEAGLAASTPAVQAPSPARTTTSSARTSTSAPPVQVTRPRADPAPSDAEDEDAKDGGDRKGKHDKDSDKDSDRGDDKGDD